MKEKKNIPEIRFEGFEGEWEEKRIGELGDIVTGSTPSTQEPLYYSNHGIPWVTPTDITENITYHTAKYLSEKGKQVSRLVPKNSILVTCIASIGKNTMLGTLGSFNQQINGLIPDENKYNTYFLYTESTLWSNEMKRSAASGTMQIVNKKEFSELKTFIPTIEEQSQIGSYFQNLDKQITLEQQKHDKLVTLKKAMLEKMFPKEGASVPEIRLKGSYNKWVQDILENVTDVRDGTHASPKYQLEGHPFITSKNLKNGDINYEDVNYITDSDFNEINKRSNVDVNDILMGMIGTIGNIALIRKSPDFAIKNVALIKDIGRVYYLYLYYFLQTPFLTKQLSNGMDGGTQKFIALNKIRKLSILFPSKEIQSQIGTYFQNLDKLISLQQQKIDKLKNIKKACLDKMFV